MKTFILLLIIAMVANKSLTVKSPAFGNNESIPSKYSCDGSNINPEITIKDIPEEARSLAIIMDDPDAPGGNFDHWLMWNIPVKDRIEENSAPGVEGKNGRNENKYTGPCPPSGTHHYHFKVYALDSKLDLSTGADKNMLLKAMDKHILASGELVGLFKR